MAKQSAFADQFKTTELPRLKDKAPRKKEKMPTQRVLYGEQPKREVKPKKKMAFVRG